MNEPQETLFLSLLGRVSQESKFRLFNAELSEGPCQNYVNLNRGLKSKSKGLSEYDPHFAPLLCYFIDLSYLNRTRTLLCILYNVSCINVVTSV